MLTKNIPIQFSLLIKTIFLLPDNKKYEQANKKDFVVY